MRKKYVLLAVAGVGAVALQRAMRDPKRAENLKNRANELTSRTKDSAASLKSGLDKKAEQFFEERDALRSARQSYHERTGHEMSAGEEMAFRRAWREGKYRGTNPELPWDK